MVIIKLTQEVIDKIPVLYSQYGSQKKVAEELGISASTVRRYLDLFQVARKERAKKAILDAETVDKINKRYQEIRNMAQVGREFGISATAVRAHLTEESLTLKEQEINDRDALFFYIFRLFGRYSEDKPVSPWNLTQMQKFKSQGIPYRGQLLTLQYFFDICHNSIEKSNGSIGIIPYKLEEAKAYYKKQDAKSKEITEGIARQLEKDRVEININPADYFKKGKKKKLIDLSTIEGEEE